MSDLQHRAFSTDLELAPGEGRTIRGIAVPFNSPTEINEFGRNYTEEFVRGSFTRTIAERGPQRVKFLDSHDSHGLLGRASLLREDSAGLYSEFLVSKTQRGDEILELVRDGALDSLSVGFIPVANDIKGNGAHVTRKEVKLREVSAVTFPAYSGATISGIRSLSTDDYKAAQEAYEQIRAGSEVPADNMAALRHVLSFLSAEDATVEEARPLFTKLFGMVPNDSRDDDLLFSFRAWDGPATEKALPNTAAASEYEKLYAYHIPGEPADQKSSYKFPYRDVSGGKVGAPNIEACLAGIDALNGARGGADIPDAAKKTVYSKLAACLKAAGKTPPPLRSESGKTYAQREADLRALGITR